MSAIGLTAAGPFRTVMRRRVAGTGVDSEARWSSLMRAAQRGDGAAYVTLLHDCVPIIRAIALRAGVAPSAADDVVQEVLLTLHRARGTYDPAFPFMPWLRTIATRRAIDLLRSSGRRQGRELHSPDRYASHPDPAPTAWQALDGADDGNRLRNAVAGLPDGQRQAVELLGLQELSLDEASSLTGRTKVALKVNLHRALKSLRVRMGGRDV